MNTLLRCIPFLLLASVWPLASAAAPGHGSEGTRDYDEDDDDADSSGSGSGRDDDRDDDRDNSGPGSGDDRDEDRDDDRDNSGSGSGSDYEQDRDDNSGPGSGDDRDDDHDNSGSGSGDDDYEAPSGGSDDDDYEDNSGSGSGSGDDHEYGEDNSGSDSGSSGGESGGADAGENSGSGSGSHGEATADHAALELRHDTESHLEHPLYIDRDEDGFEFVRDEALLLATPRDVALVAARGFAIISERRMSADGRVVARLLTPTGMSVDDAVAAIRALAPNAIVSRNTIFRSAQASSLVASSPSARRNQSASRGVLGIIDTGADTTFLRRGSVVATRAFGNSAYAPREHGSVVAAIAAASGVRVQIADVFGVASDGDLAASADAIVAAIDWMIVSGVPVVNISIEGPDNPLLTDIVRRATQRGHIIVAAAGNSGPLGAPSFPAALDGAVAVTAVDNTNHAYRRANRGDYIAFAAPGVDVEVPLGPNMVRVSGTSFAAPYVAARLAARHARPSASHARAAIDALRASAVDLGRPGRDPIFGWGLISD
ncbi:hypothetical protein U91I_01937 [alpha proteobacterium U9-1i]|nr:hypothetical protein U91I_01937 [alpha proteobacterium U9-1i]